MIIKRLQAGVYAANCYLVIDENTKDTFIVDPGGDSDDILDIVKKEALNVKGILLTHGHGDHIGGVLEIKNSIDVPVYIHQQDEEMIKDAAINLSNAMPGNSIAFKADILLKSNDILTLGEQKIRVLHTPGHTRGGICLVMDGCVITGDTLFKGSIGRTDLYGGDYETIINSIVKKLMVLPDDYIVYSGHGLPSTIKDEKKRNPFIKDRY